MDLSILRNTPLFKGLSESDIEKIMKRVPGSIRKYREGTIIAQSGDEVTSLRIVTAGVVKGEMVDYSGRVITIEDIPAPGSIASAFIFGSRNRFPVNVVAVTDAELLVIEKSDFLRMLAGNYRILSNFLDMISDRSQFLSEKIKFLNFKTIKGKLAQFILQKAGSESTSVILEMKQEEIAGFFGVARPSVSRALGEMEEKGLIKAKGRNITVLDKKGLAELTLDS